MNDITSPLHTFLQKIPVSSQDNLVRETLHSFEVLLQQKGISPETSAFFANSVLTATVKIFSDYVVAELGKEEVERISAINDEDKVQNAVEEAFVKKTGISLSEKFETMLQTYVASFELEQ